MIDRTLLLELFDHNDALVARVLNIYKEQAPTQLESLSEAIANQDWENASISAHSIKSQCSYLGLSEAVKLCQTIEEQPSAPEVPDRLMALSEIIKEILSEIG